MGNSNANFPHSTLPIYPSGGTLSKMRRVRKLIQDSFNKELKARNILNAHQLMENRSCQTNLISFLDEITDVVDKGNCRFDRLTLLADLTITSAPNNLGGSRYHIICMLLYQFNCNKTIAT